MPVAVAANAIISWSEYKTMFGITDNDEQDRYQTLINQGSSRIEQFCKRSLKATAYTGGTALILDGTGRETLISPHYPVNAITGLYIDTDRAFGAASLLDSSDYTFYAKTGFIRLFSRCFPDMPATVKLECNAGYAASSPEWQIIQGACFELVKWMAGRLGATGFIGMRSQTNADGMNVSWELDMPMNIKEMLRDFRDSI
jgi:hypothetical protein